MRTATIRAIDYYSGRTGCFVLTCLRRILRALGIRERPKGPARKIFFIKLVEQGATVLAYDALERAIALVGRDHVYFCAFEKNREILDILGVIPDQNILTIRTDTPLALIKDTLHVIARARRDHVDAIIDMEFFARGSAMLAYLCGGTRRVGIDRFTCEAPYRGNLMTHRLQHNPYVHTAVAYRLLVEALQHPPDTIPQGKVPTDQFAPAVPVFHPEEEERERLCGLLVEATGWAPGKPLVVLNPNSDDSLTVRKWPLERYTQLGKRILESHPDATIAIVGTPEERGPAAALAAAIDAPNAVSLAGQTSLRDVVVLLALGDVLVTNDCGPAHFAAMTPIHVVVFFGPETPTLFRPLGDRVHVIHKPLACSPCLNVLNHRLSPCHDNRCIQAITVDEVYAAVQDCLAQRQS